MARSTNPPGKHGSDGLLRSYHTQVPAIDGQLRAGRSAERLAQQETDGIGHVLQAHLYSKHVLLLVLLDAHAISGRRSLEHLRRPHRPLEDRNGMDHIEADLPGAKLEVRFP